MKPKTTDIPIENEEQHSELYENINENTFKVLVQNLPDMVFRYDKNLRVIFLNEQVLTQLHVKNKEELMYKTTLEAGYPEEIANPWMEKIAAVFETKQKLSHYEIHKFAEGVEYLHSILAPEFDDEGNVQTVLTITRNVTELNKFEQELEIKNSQLARKNTELEEFSYVAAHDLKAPLTNLQSLIALIDNKINEESRNIFDKIKQVTETLKTKLNAFNEVIEIKSSLRVGKEQINFEVLMADIKNELQEEIEDSGVKINTDFKDCSQIKYSPSQLHSIFFNVLINAIKYRNKNRDLVVDITARKCNGKTLISVRDNGLGFDEEMGKNKIFGLFKRMHSHPDGLGVGLYIVKTIVNSHGGYIEVSSEPNIGTEFKLYL